MIPNRESGKLEPVAVTPDYKALAQDLKSKGFTYQDIKEQGTAVLRDAPSKTLTNPEGSRSSDPEAMKPEQKEGGTPASVQKLLSAFESLEAEDATPVQGGVKPFSGGLFEEASQFNFADVFGQGSIIDTTLTKLGSSEMSLLLSGVLDRTKEELTEEFSSGNTVSISEASSIIMGNNERQEVERITKEIEVAETPEAVAKVLKDKADTIDRPISMIDMRQNFVVNSMQVPPSRMIPLSLNIEKDAVRATELAKLQEKVWDETSLLGVIGDFGELIIPTGVISEEYDKFDNGLTELLENVKAAPKEKQEEVFNAFVDSWLETETFLIGNNNSLLITDQLAGLESAIREGGLGLIANGGTSAEFEDDLETFINTTIFAYEFKAVGKGITGLMKFLGRRIFPSNKDVEIPNQRVPFVPFTEARNTLVIEQPNTARIVEGVKSVREGLVKEAAKKDTRKVRMTLEQEKKELGALKESLKSESVNAEARALANKEKIKFKDALKTVNANKQEQLDAVARRQATVQEMIGEFDRAATAEAKLSRLDTFVKDGRATDKDLLEPSGEYKVDMGYDTRPETSVYDQVAKNYISEFYKGVNGKGLKQLGEEGGLSPEALAARLLSTPSPTTDLGYPNIMDEVNELLLMDEDVLEAGAKRAKALARSTGSSLKLQDSGVAIVENADPKSRGDFKFLLGDGDEGFKHASDAEEAMNASLVGVDKKTVVERNGKWYIEVEQKHEFNPRYDTTDLFVNMSDLNNKSSLLLDPLRRLGQDVLSGISVLKLYNRSVAQKMQSELEAIFTKDTSIAARVGLRPMKADDVNSLIKALKHTDQDGVDWIANVDDYAEVIGKSVGDAGTTWSRYQRLQKIMDDIYQVRNEKFRKSLVARNVKDVKIGDEVQRGAVQLKVDVKEVYDTILKKNVSVADLDPSQAIIKLEKAVLDEAGEYRRLVVANRADVKELPAKVLEQRAGHIDRFYRDAGWTVKVPNVRVVDGVEEKSFNTTHIVKSEKEAQAAARKILEENGDEALVVRARENDDLDGIYGDEGSVQYGYAGVHTKQRGVIRKGSDGVNEAETLNVMESIARSVGSIERQLDVDVVNSLRARFLKQFEKYFKQRGGTSYSSRLSDMIDKGTIPTDVEEKVRQWHNYIESIAQVKQGEGYAWIDNKVKLLTSLGVDSQAISSALQNFATQMVIVGRPVFQIIQNTTQLLYIAQKYPAEMASTAYRLLPTLMALSRPTPFNIKMLSKTMGGDEALAKSFIEEMQINGLWDAVGMSDDFMRMVQRNSIDASSSKLGNAGGVLKNAAMLPFTASKAGQESIIKLANLTAYMSEFQKQVIKGGKKFDAKTKKDMSFNSQKITQTQNSVNQFDYQSKASLLSPMFQFTQHVHKLYLDVIVDPALKITKDPIMKALGKKVPERVSPLASTHLQAVGSLITTYMVFGPQGLLGGILGAKAEDAINQIENPIAREVLQGNMLNQVVNSTVNYLGAEGQVDFSSKMHPASVIDTFYDYHIEKFATEGTLSVAGAAGYVGGMVASAGKAVVAIASNEGFTWDDKASNIITEVMTTVAGVSDAQRAYMSYHLGNYVYKSSLSGNLPITAYEAVAQLGNFTPTAIQDRWSEFSSSSPANDDAVKSLGKVFSRMMHRELAEAQSFEEMMVIASTYSNIAQNSVDPLKRGDMVTILARYVSPTSNKDYRDYFKPYIDQKDLNDVVSELKSLREDASTDEMRSQVDTQIAIIESMIPAIEEAYGK